MGAAQHLRVGNGPDGQGHVGAGDRGRRGEERERGLGVYGQWFLLRVHKCNGREAGENAPVTLAWLIIISAEAAAAGLID